MSKKVVIESIVKEGVQDKLLPFLAANLPNTRGFEGCLNVTVFLDQASRKMIFDEEWLSANDHQKYIDTIAGTGVMAELITFLEAPPEIKYFDRIEI